MSEHDPVNHPKHYTSHPSGIEAIQITRHMGFNLGNAMKYVWRADLKNGVEDLRKAAWYIADEIQKREDALREKVQGTQNKAEICTSGTCGKALIHTTATPCTEPECSRLDCNTAVVPHPAGSHGCYTENVD